MQLQLFVSDSFAPCRDAERVWGYVARESDLELNVIDVRSDAGRALAEGLRIAIVPALAVDDRLLSVGVPTVDEARSLLRKRRSVPASVEPQK